MNLFNKFNNNNFFLKKSLIATTLVFLLRLKHKDTEEGLQFMPNRLVGVIKDRSQDNDNEFLNNVVKNNFQAYKSKLPNKLERTIGQMKAISLKKRLNIDVIPNEQSDPFAITRILADAFKNHKDRISKVLLHVQTEQAHNIVINKLQQAAPELVEGFDKLGKQIISKLKLDDEFSDLIEKVKSSSAFDNFKPDLPNKPYVFKEAIQERFGDVKHVRGFKRIFREDLCPGFQEKVKVKPAFHGMFERASSIDKLDKLEKFLKNRAAKQKKSFFRRIKLFLKKFFRLFYISPVKVKKFIKNNVPVKIAGLFTPFLNKLKSYNKLVQTIVLFIVGALVLLGFGIFMYLIIKLIIFLIKKIKKFYNENSEWLVNNSIFNYQR